MESTNVKLHQNYSDNPTEFESIDDFNNYYKINKADIDKLSTHAINLKYKVKNHRFGRKKGQLILFPSKLDGTQQQNTNSDELSIHEKLNRLNERFKKIESFIKTPPINYNLILSHALKKVNTKNKEKNQMYRK